MIESLKIFNSILEEDSISKIPIFLIFNKIDIFEEKIKNFSNELIEIFSDYKKEFDFENSKKFLKEKYLEKNENEKKKIFVHFTNFKDEKNVQNVLNEILKNI